MIWKWRIHTRPILYIYCYNNNDNNNDDDDNDNNDNNNNDDDDDDDDNDNDNDKTKAKILWGHQIVTHQHILHIFCKIAIGVMHLHSSQHWFR